MEHKLSNLFIRIYTTQVYVQSRQVLFRGTEQSANGSSVMLHYNHNKEDVRLLLHRNEQSCVRKRVVLGIECAQIDLLFERLR